MRICMVCGWISVSAAFLLLIASPQSIVSDWTPKRIFGMDYPVLAARARVEGQMEITCTIKPDGSVESAVPSWPARPHPLLVKFAEENAKRWLFKKNTSSTANRITLSYTFRMESKGSYRPRSEFIFEYPNHVIVTSELYNLETEWMK